MSVHQQRAADPSISAFVTANAGSGKTKTLIDRTARLLLKGVRPEAILCVTFTKAAAAEMQRRLFDRLGGWSVADDASLAQALSSLEGRRIGADDAATLSRARTLFARALETPGGLRIQTIHAFCERLLRRFPLEAGVSPTFQVIDDAAAAAIVAAAKASVAECVRETDDAFLSEAYARFSVALDFQSFERMFADFETHRGAIADYIARCGGVFKAAADAWIQCGFTQREDRNALAEAAFDALNLSAWVEAARLFREAGTNLGCAAALERAVFSREFEEALAAVTTAKGEPAKVFEKAAALRPREDVRAAMLRDQQNLIAAMGEIRAADIATDTGFALALANLYIERYEAEKRRRGVLDFTDLVRKARDLLKDSAHAAWVLYKLDGGIDHILVDEAQDTAADQWAILDGLTEEFFAGASRPADRPVERTLFVVGDEKQSIYGFQGADPALLQEKTRRHVERITASGRTGEKVPLEISYRSTEQVLTFVDRLFDHPERREGLTGDQGAPVRHVLAREGHAGCVDLWSPEQERKEAEREAWDDPLDVVAEHSAYRRLADRIAREIAAIVARGDAVFDNGRGGWRAAGYGDVLILVRRRGVMFEEILRALKRERIPVAGADRLALKAHIVFDDLLALARFALFPADELTLAALLKSPFCGFDDEALYALAHDRRGVPLWNRLRRRREERPDWAAAAAFLEGVVEAARTQLPFAFYQRILAGLDAQGRSGRMRLLARLGREAEDAIDEFLGQVLAAEQRGARDLERLAAELSRLDIFVKREMDEGKGEVRVMTAHGAKGLEAPIVFLPEMTPIRTPRGSPLLRTASGGFLWAPRKSDDCAASADARAARERRESAELYRLFYVALTRARDRLVLCGRLSSTDKPDRLDGWYGAAVTTLDALGAEVRTIGEGEAAFRRYGPDPVPAPRAAPGAPSALVTPAWLSAPPRPEPKGMRYVSPTALAERAADPAVSPLAAAADGLGRFRRGTIIHRLLQLLPDVAPDARRAGAEALLAREPGLSEEQRAEMAAAALGVLEDERFSAVFGPGSRAEVAVAGEAPGLPPGVAIGGRIDRLVVEPDRVVVVDFKTNRPAPSRIEEADPAYISQMAAYVAVLREAFPGRRIEAALVWTDGPKLMPVPEKLLDSALAELGANA